MTIKVEEETIEHIGKLAKLNLTPEEKKQAKKEMEDMLVFMEKLRDVSIKEEPMEKMSSESNVLREDVITNKNQKESLLFNAPEQKNGCFKVPKTI
ncbi:MAG: Asp-tRNA(Asn)/Glu-tRNA(Gln) amidotransferase subunit GatC [Acetivibrio sp.]